MKPFYDWMIGKYAGKDTVRGDLAEDMKRSGDFAGFNDRDGGKESQEGDP